MLPPASGAQQEAVIDNTGQCSHRPVTFPSISFHRAALIYCSPPLWPMANALDWTFLGSVLFLTQMIAEVSHKYLTESHQKSKTEFSLYSSLPELANIHPNR